VTVLLWLKRAIQRREVGVVVEFLSVLAQRIDSGASFFAKTSRLLDFSFEV